MRIRFDFALLLPFLMIFLLSLAGCGGGGGSASAAVASAADESLFNGDYHFTAFSIANPGTVLGNAQWGVFSADGDGTVTGAASINIDGSVTTDVSSGDLSYAVDADYGLRWQLAADPTVDSLVGGISSDGSAYVAATVTSGSSPYIMVGARKSGSFSTADLNGRYHMVGILADTGGAQQLAFWGRAIFDGAGGVDLTADYNVNGTLGGIPLNTGAYTVSVDGEVTWALGSSSDELTGGLLSGGDLVILAGTVNTGGAPTMFVLIPEQLGSSTASLSGTYQFVGFEASTSGAFEARTGTLVADGAGTLEAELTNNSDGVISEVSSGEVTYSVAANGGLTLNGTAPLAGGVTHDGRFFVLAGGTSSGDAPTIVIGLK